MAKWSDMIFFRTSLIFPAITCLPAQAIVYYVDPAAGSMANDGSVSRPWSTLEAVFLSGKTFSEGDTIILRSGNHGSPRISGRPAGQTVIRAETGANPKAQRVTFASAANWILSGLDISPENSASPVYGGTLVDIQPGSENITVRDCSIRFANSTTSWSLGQWQSRAGNAIFSRAPRTVIERNDIINSGFPVTLYVEAAGSAVRDNTIRNFSMDAFRGLADDCIFEGNSAVNSLTSDSNHDDFFQSWSVDSSGNVGRGTVRNVIIRNNVFLSATDPAHPLLNPPQGIGCFDGMFENWVIENNVISTRTYHGIALFGAVNCRIVNNTVTENAPSGTGGIQPWIRIYEHKDYTTGSSFPPKSSGNVVRNNVCCWGASIPSGAGAASHNIGTTSYASHYQNFPAFDFYPADTSPLRGAGFFESAPTEDIMGKRRTQPADIGAFVHSGSIRDQGIFSAEFNRGANGFTDVRLEARLIPGETYLLQSTGTLASWENLSTVGSHVPHFTWRTAEPADRLRRFYRIIRSTP